jgi:hypothetical protein
MEAADSLNASLHNLSKLLISNQGPLDGMISLIMLHSSSLLLWLRVFQVNAAFVSLPDLIFVV